MPITTAPITGTWRVDRAHSTVGFAVRHMVVSTFRGRFEDFDATLAVEDGTPQVRGRAGVASLVLKDPDQAAHLLSADFFDAGRHPDITFTSTSVRVHGGRVELDGRLTMRGTCRPVRVTGTVEGPVEDPFGGTRLALALEAEVDRREFGMDWNLPLPKGGLALGNDVRLLVDLELVRA
jgi:polyisoprenoid-binding protein YceI